MSTQFSSAKSLQEQTQKHWLKTQEKTLGTLVLLTLLFPFNAGVVVLVWAIDRIRDWVSPRQPHFNGETVLLTGGKMTKALQLARSFYRAGHRVILVETHKYWLSGHRFSRAVQRFYTVPIPEQDPQSYTEALVKIAKQEKVTLFIPVSSPVGSYFDAMAGEALTKLCRVVHLDPKTTQNLDDKFQFCQQAKSSGLSVPNHYRITNPQQVLQFNFGSDPRRYILKNIRYNSVARLNLKVLPCDDIRSYVESLPISPDNPWIMQEFITGQEFCVHTTVCDGSLRMYCCAPSSPFQVNYTHVDNPAIQAWVEIFVQKFRSVKGEPLTGQLSFDFIQAADGTVYPLECNPRTHSAITMFYNHPGVAAAYLNQTSALLTPLPTSRPTYWLYHELWRLTQVRSWADLVHRIRGVLGGKEALWESWDPLPFLMVPHWQITVLLLQNLFRAKEWIRIDFNIGKLVEPGGD